MVTGSGEGFQRNGTGLFGARSSLKQERIYEHDNEQARGWLARGPPEGVSASGTPVGVGAVTLRICTHEETEAKRRQPAQGHRAPRTDLLQVGLVGSPCSPRDSQESSPTPQFKSINSSVDLAQKGTVLSGSGLKQQICAFSHSSCRSGSQLQLNWMVLPHGNPLQCSCLENPRDRGAWWAAIYPSAFPRPSLALEKSFPKWSPRSVSGSEISPSNEFSGLISFRIDWFHFFAVQGTLKSLLQYHSSKASILQSTSHCRAK